MFGYLGMGKITYEILNQLYTSSTSVVPQFWATAQSNPLSYCQMLVISLDILGFR